MCAYVCVYVCVCVRMCECDCVCLRVCVCASELRKKAKAYDAKFDMREVQGLGGRGVGGERCV